MLCWLKPCRWESALSHLLMSSTSHYNALPAVFLIAMSVSTPFLCLNRQGNVYPSAAEPQGRPPRTAAGNGVVMANLTTYFIRYLIYYSRTRWRKCDAKTMQQL
jgi:hypothetical protein